MVNLLLLGGHLIAASQSGCRPEYILLWPMGGLAVTANAAQTYKARGYISLMGPLTHLPMFVFWCILLAMSGVTPRLSTTGMDVEGDDWWSILCIQQLMMNVVMFCFNALVNRNPSNLQNHEPRAYVRCLAFPWIVRAWL